MPDWVDMAVGGAALMLVLFSMKGVFEFRRYCEAVAVHQSRTDEYDVVSAAGRTFEIEQYRRLMSGDFSGLNDAGLVARAHKLASTLKQVRLLAVALVAGLAIFYWYKVLN